MNLKKVSANALSILSSDVMNRVTSFVLYAMVARHLGAQEFGQLTLALTLFYTFQVFAVGGLKTLIVRQVAKDRSQTRLYFLNGLLIVAFTSIVSLIALWSFVYVMHYPLATTRVILLLSFGLVPYTISAVCEGLFQAWERMPYIACVNVPVNVAKVVGAFVLLTMNRSLYSVVLVLLASLAVIAVVEVWILLSKFSSPPASIDIRFSLRTMRTAATFLGIDGTLAIMSSLNIILLSKLAT